MTVSDACERLVALTLELSEARRDRDSYRRLAQQLLHFAHDLQDRHRRSELRYLALLEELRTLRNESTRRRVA